MKHFDVNLCTRALSAVDELFKERPYDIVGMSTRWCKPRMLVILKVIDWTSLGVSGEFLEFGVYCEDEDHVEIYDVYGRQVR